MSAQNIKRTTALVVLAVGLAVLLSVPAQAQEGDESGEGLSWRQNFTTSEGIQQQFESNPVLFFAAIFAMGVATSLTPCVLPMIPITISIITGSKQEVAGRTALRNALSGLASSVVYVLGVSLTYALLGILAVVLKSVLLRVTLQSWWVQSIIGGIFVILGLSMLGVFSLPIPGWGRAQFDALAQRQKAKKSLITILVLGIISGLIASPCVAPVIGALLVWISQTARIWLGFWTLFIFGWGMGLLLIVLGVTGWTLSSGKWMVTVKIILGLVLMITGAWIIIQGIRAQPLIPASWLPG